MGKIRGPYRQLDFIEPTLNAIDPWCFQMSLEKFLAFGFGPGIKCLAVKHCGPFLAMQ
jgi:hypothetical protein